MISGAPASKGLSIAGTLTGSLNPSLPGVISLGVPIGRIFLISGSYTFLYRLGLRLMIFGRPIGMVFIFDTGTTIGGASFSAGTLYGFASTTVGGLKSKLSCCCFGREQAAIRAEMSMRSPLQLLIWRPLYGDMNLLIIKTHALFIYN